MARSTSVPTSRSGGFRRMLALAGIVSFVSVFFAIPLYAALMICNMPCCHHGETGGSAALAVPGMGGCESQCAIRETSATATVDSAMAAPEKHESAVALEPASVGTADGFMPRVAPQRDRSPGLSHPHASLQILNSVFRI